MAVLHPRTAFFAAPPHVLSAVETNVVEIVVRTLSQALPYNVEVGHLRVFLRALKATSLIAKMPVQKLVVFWTQQACNAVLQSVANVVDKVVKHVLEAPTGAVSTI